MPANLGKWLITDFNWLILAVIVAGAVAIDVAVRKFLR